MRVYIGRYEQTLIEITEYLGDNKVIRTRIWPKQNAVEQYKDRMGYINFKPWEKRGHIRYRYI